jgi:hypothetical protein
MSSSTNMQSFRFNKYLYKKDTTTKTNRYLNSNTFHVRDAIATQIFLFFLLHLTQVFIS